MPFNFRFRAKCLEVIDGDTLHLYIDTGFHKYEEQHVRLLGVNTPELHDKDPFKREAAQAAKEFTKATVAEWAAKSTDGWPLYLESYKGDSFGRWLCTVWPSSHLLAVDLSTLIIQNGHGVPYMVAKP